MQIVVDSLQWASEQGYLKLLTVTDMNDKKTQNSLGIKYLIYKMQAYI